VSIVQRNGSVDVRVRDDGEGFEPDQPASGFGLAGMRERVALAGGDLEIDSAPGRGTAVRARFPLAGGEGPGARAAG
jgi:signal transduction histidine kinase